LCTEGWLTGGKFSALKRVRIKDLSEEVFEEQEHPDTQEGETGSDKAVNSDEERRVVNEAFDANSAVK